MRVTLFIKRRSLWITAIAFLLMALAGYRFIYGNSSSIFSAPKNRSIGNSYRSELPDPPLPDKLDLLLAGAQPLPPVASRSKPKVFILGFDGTSWKVLRPLLAGGELPNFHRLCAAGSFGRLKTDVGYSPVSWTSLMTGMGSEKHGIAKTDDPQLTWGQSYRKRVFHVWDLLVNRGYKIGLVNYEFLSEQFLPPNTFFLRDNQAVPPDLINDFESKDTAPPEEEKKYWEADRKALYLMKNKPFDVFIYTTAEPDDTHHSDYFYYALAQAFGIENVQASPSAVRQIRQGRDAVRNAYHRMDYFLGEVLDQKPDYVFIVSDHGVHSESLSRTVRFTRALYQALNLLPPFVKENEEPLCGVSENGLCRLYTQTEPQGSVEIRKASEEFAFCEVPSAGLKVKSEIRYPQIRISYQTAPPQGFSIMLKKASELKCEGDPVVRFYSKGYSAEITLSSEMTQRILDGRGTCGFFESQTYGANHDGNDDGILIMRGKGFRNGFEIAGAQLYDLVPTLLYILGEPVAKDFDGKVLSDAVETSYLALHPIQTIDTYGRPENLPDQKRVLTEEEIRRLKALGYISD